MMSHVSLRMPEPAAQEERRRGERHKLILRVAVLEQAGTSALCLVKDVSPIGVRVKLYSRTSVGAEVIIQVADELPVAGRIAWIEGDVGGISFHNRLDAPILLRVQQKVTPVRRRGTPRVTVEASAILRTGGRVCRAAVCDISSFGARVRTRSVLATGAQAVVAFPDLPSINAYVRWTDDTESGLAFDAPIPMQVISHWIEGRARVSA